MCLMIACRRDKLVLPSAMYMGYRVCNHVGMVSRKGDEGSRGVSCLHEGVSNLLNCVDRGSVYVYCERGDLAVKREGSYSEGGCG